MRRWRRSPLRLSAVQDKPFLSSVAANCLLKPGSFWAKFIRIMALSVFRNKRTACLVTLIVAALNISFRLNAAQTGEEVSFNNQIQPLLSEYCYHCHGPDSAARKPKKHPIRLDKEQFAFEPRDDGKPVIVKGHPETSELVRRVTATDDDIMPPASEH